jgi:hypothetical protein
MIYVIRLRQISTGHESDSMLFRGTEAEARAHAEAGIAASTLSDDLEIASIRPREDARLHSNKDPTS